MNSHVFILAALLSAGVGVAHAEPAAPAAALQADRAGQQDERITRKIRLGQNGRLVVANVAGQIVLTGGSGDEVSIEAVKRTRGDRSELALVAVDIEERAGRIVVRTNYRPQQNGRRNRNSVAVDFTITLPASTDIDARSISGNVRVTGIRGIVRAETVSGDVVTSQSPRIEVAKSISGTVDLSNTDADGELAASTVSGTIRARGLKARGIQLSTVSGDVDVSEVSAERLEMKSVSGDLVFAGALARNARYSVNSHSGDVRLTLGSDAGFELVATSFSGDVRSDIPVTLGGSRRSDPPGRRGSNRRSVRAVFGDGSATLDVTTFSGDILISRQ